MPVVIHALYNISDNNNNLTKIIITYTNDDHGVVTIGRIN